ncbi:NADPH-dependent F420 reductase [Pseudarthrobacter sp. C4D7]|uniref:NADPH-dependent F420 reductase n=1 Tax=Pseudarthrobacter sp. C4D7 TaxID=2735268 RepID=UPI001584DA63|nr:NAD(P)-binding domain-containing protein [Pseudarthrobacter sp. C4D7]NUT72557.1 NAD(P)-binding domain-containing protein [Pseudarthrobacter sp. C4D7]
MEIAVLGTGTVGRTLAAAFSALGHGVVLGTRDPGATAGRAGPGPMGGTPFREWQAGHAGIGLETFAEAAGRSALVVNATNGAGSLAALAAAGAAALEGKVLVDVANPLDFSHGMPPLLDPVNADSLGEQIQRAFPGAKVVKTLNTMNAGIMVDPGRLANADHSVFLSGDDAAAKETVSGLLRELGHRDIIDLGDITTARGAEMVLPLWLRLFGALGTPNFNFKIVRGGQGAP